MYVLVKIGLRIINHVHDIVERFNVYNFRISPINIATVSYTTIPIGT